MELRRVGPEHRVHLETFACAERGDLVALEVQQIIREDVPRHLAAGIVDAVGAWAGDTLVGLAVYAPSSWAWHLDVLAVDLRRRRNRQGSRLLREVQHRAGAAGATVVVAYVHEENVRMRCLVEKFGGVEDDPPEPIPYRVCTLRAHA